jgi:2-haloacid dehalogenase
MISFDNYDVLTFDCYGTLIDWESGIVGALAPVFKANGISISERELLELYAVLEAEAEKGEYRDYKNIQASVVASMGKQFHFTPSSKDLLCISDSIRFWKPFSDTVESLRLLHTKYKLAIISNIDDDLFAWTEKQLQIKFDWVITAQQVRSYKPSENNFRKAIERMGVPKERILHVAQSIFHDIVPTKKLGISNVWVNRRKVKQGFGATLPANEQPDIEVSDLQSLVNLMGLG